MLVAAVSLDCVLLLAGFDHSGGHFNDAVVFVSRTVLHLDWAQKIMEGTSWVSLDATMVAPGILTSVAFSGELFEKVFVTVVAILACGLASFAPFK